MKSLRIALLASVLLACVLDAQSLVITDAFGKPIAAYEVGVWRAADDITKPPFVLTQLSPQFFTCGRTAVVFSDESASGIPNPETLIWDDDSQPGKYCSAKISSIVFPLPIATNYKLALRAVGVDGLTSSWMFPHGADGAIVTWRRAPRGIPCPNGQPGVLVTERADINGKDTLVQLCIQMPQ